MKSLKELIKSIDDPRMYSILGIYEDNKDLFHYAKGSGFNHQAWPGGYADHIAECIRINRITYPALNSFRELSFTMGQADICLFFHDIEKPFRYGPKNHQEVLKWHKWHELWMNGGDGDKDESYEGWEAAKWEIIRKFNFELTSEEINALKYTHGEGSDHKKEQRVALPLAAHVHHCDNISARIYFNDGKGLG